MELLQLRYFFESAQSGSFSKTAKKYMVPLTSVSASIRRLEQELGCPLFVRHPNCVSLNEKGKILQNKSSTESKGLFKFLLYKFCLRYESIICGEKF